jgi:phenylalanyl-tRNA synthetase beta chain
MRTSLWPGLIQALQYNLNRQHKRVRLFEVGVRFLLQGGGKDADIIADKIREENIVAGIACGDRHVEQWGVDSRAVDFFDIKADIEVLLGLTGRGETFRFVTAANPVLHPGQSARILSDDGAAIGWCGLLHPSIQSSLGLERDVFLFELDVTTLQRGDVARFRALSRYPVIRRDLAIVVDRAIPAARIQAAIAEVAGDLLRETIIFDVYTGKGVDSDAKSLAIGLTLQEFSRTLTDDEVEALVGRVLSHLEVTFGATLRE